MRYAVWNNKGGVGKTFLTFVLGTEVAKRQPDEHVVLVDMCPQANLSEIVLGGNSLGSKRLDKLITAANRKTVGGYLDSRITSPHQMTSHESEYLLKPRKQNHSLPENLWLIAGDPSLEIQAQVISQIGGQTLPQDAWKNVHNWISDLVISAIKRLGAKTRIFIDCNPSFSAYTELSMMAAEQLIVPCSSDGSSARAIDNLGKLLYGVGNGTAGYGEVSFAAKAGRFEMPVPIIHSVLLNRSTLYSEKASKAFGAMFNEIKRRTDQLRVASPASFISGQTNFKVIPDNHSVAIVCSHLGMPLYSIQPGKYNVHDSNPQVNSVPLNRYKAAVDELVNSLL